MFGSSRKLPRIPQPGPRIISCWCSIHQHTSQAADAASESLGCVPAAKYTVDHEAEADNTNFDGQLFSLVKC